MSNDDKKYSDELYLELQTVEATESPTTGVRRRGRPSAFPIFEASTGAPRQLVVEASKLKKLKTAVANFNRKNPETQVLVDVESCETYGDSEVPFQYTVLLKSVKN